MKTWMLVVVAAVALLLLKRRTAGVVTDYPSPPIPSDVKDSWIKPPWGWKREGDQFPMAGAWTKNYNSHVDSKGWIWATVRA